MRRRVLLRSIQRFLDPNEQIVDAAYMWIRHPYGYVYSFGAFVVVVLMATLAGVEEWSGRFALGVLALAVALTACTQNWVLAQTTTGRVLLEGGRVRQVATGLTRRIPADAPIEIQRDTLITTDWKVDGVEYTVTKASQRAIERIAARY